MFRTRLWLLMYVAEAVYKSLGNIQFDSQQGVERLTMNINGSIPGPLITADWGDNCEPITSML